MATIDDVSWVQMRATVHVLDWQIGEIRMANLQDPEIRGLVNAGLLVIIDDETAALLPATPTPAPGRGCGCGH